MKPIAVISSHDAYKHLCHHCNLPERNNQFRHVGRSEAARGIEFSGVLFCGDLSKVPDIEYIEAIVRTMIR